MKENWPTSKLTLFTYVVAPLSYFFNTWSKIHVDLSYYFCICFSILFNAIIWNIVDGFINSFPTLFRQTKNQELQFVYGVESPKPRWRTCASLTNTLFKPATVLLYANKYFSEDAIKKVRIKNVWWINRKKGGKRKEHWGEVGTVS